MDEEHKAKIKEILDSGKTDDEKFVALEALASDEHLWLKFGTWKSYNCANNEAMREALDKYNTLEDLAPSTMQQGRNTEEQIEAMCDAIDACNGQIRNDWTGEDMTKNEAKQYIREYGKEEGSKAA